jgi:hypothetical protein
MHCEIPDSFEWKERPGNLRPPLGAALDNEQIVLIVDLESFGAELARQREILRTAITATSANIYG